MKVMSKILIASLFGLSMGQMVQAGEFRVGAGLSEVTDWDLSYTNIELGYDYDHILGATFAYGVPENDELPDRMNFAFEFGYEFGDSFTIRPYGSIGVIHMRGAGADGSTSPQFGVGARASYKFLYVNAGYFYNFENSNNTVFVDGNTEEELESIWVWDNHSSLSLTAGFKF